MMNSDEVLNRVQTETVPSDWHLFFARKDFFVEQAFFCFIFIIALIAFLIWYTLNPHIIVTNFILLNLLPGPLTVFITRNYSEVLHLSDPGLWRIVDYIASALLGGFLVLLCLDGFVHAQNPRSQFLVLLPDGVLLKKEEKNPIVIEYKSLSDLFISEYKSDKVKLTLVNEADGEEKEFELDKRFGNPKKLARDITRAYSERQTLKV